MCDRGSRQGSQKLDKGVVNRYTFYKLPSLHTGQRYSLLSGKNTLIGYPVLCYNNHGFIPWSQSTRLATEGALGPLSHNSYYERQYTEQSMDKQCNQFLDNLSKLEHVEELLAWGGYYPYSTVVYDGCSRFGEVFDMYSDVIGTVHKYQVENEGSVRFM